MSEQTFCRKCHHYDFDCTCKKRDIREIGFAAYSLTNFPSNFLFDIYSNPVMMVAIEYVYVNGGNVNDFLTYIKERSSYTYAEDQQHIFED